MHMTLAAPALHAAQPRISTLPNGFTILVQEDDRFPLTSLRLYVRAGSAYEDPAQAGISHLLEHMVFKGTAKRAPGQVAKDIESAGGYLNAATSFDYTVYMTDMPAEHWSLGLEVLHDMTLGATIDPEELEREKLVVLAELERGEDSPDSLIFNRMQPLTWPDTSYRHPIIGYRDTVTAITRQNILDYIAKFYQPQSMLLVVCGNVAADEVLAQATALFGGLTNDRSVQPVENFSLEEIMAAQAGELRIQAIPGEWNKTYLSVAFPMPGFRSASAASLEVLAHLLGGDMSSRLYRSLKYEQQLVHSISAYSLTLERVGALYISATLDTDKLDAFWAAFLKELAALNAEAFSDEELERAKLNLEDSLFQAKETLSGLASKLGFFQFFDGNANAEANYLYELRHVTREQLRELMAAQLQPETLSAVLLTPKDALPDPGALPKELGARLAELWPATGVASAAAQAGGQADAPTVLELGPGRTLVLLPDPTLPYTALSLGLLGGDTLLPPDRQGLAALVAKALTKGTRQRSANELQDFLSDRAAELNASATRDLFVLNAKFPTRFSAELLPLVEEVLTAPAFAPAEVDREKASQVAAIKSQEDQPMGLAFRRIFPFLFQEHPYSYLHLGLPEAVAAFTPEQVQGYWERQRQQPWVLAICGDFDAQAVQQLARNLAKDLGPAGGWQSAERQPPQWNTERDLTLQLAERNQTHLLQVFPLPGEGHPDSAGLKLLREILAGQSGLLFSRLRDEQGLGYSVTAMLWQSPVTGFLAFYIGTSPDKAEQAQAGFLDAVKHLQTTPLDAEAIQRGKNLLQGDYYRENQRLAARSREAATLAVHGRPLDANRADIAKARELTAQDLQELARKYLDPDRAYLLTVAP